MIFEFVSGFLLGVLLHQFVSGYRIKVELYKACPQIPFCSICHDFLVQDSKKESGCKEPKDIRFARGNDPGIVSPVSDEELFGSCQNKVKFGTNLKEQPSNIYGEGPTLLAPRSKYATMEFLDKRKKEEQLKKETEGDLIFLEKKNI